jgi:hypothetical protein
MDADIPPDDDAGADDRELSDADILAYLICLQDCMRADHSGQGLSKHHDGPFKRRIGCLTSS